MTLHSAQTIMTNYMAHNAVKTNNEGLSRIKI